MFTALLAKAVDSSVDILSLQAGDGSEGAYDARSLASKVVYRFQASLLGNVLDGSNNDPLVNKPGRFLRLSPETLKKRFNYSAQTCQRFRIVQMRANALITSFPFCLPRKRTGMQKRNTLITLLTIWVFSTPAIS